MKIPHQKLMCELRKFAGNGHCSTKFLGANYVMTEIVIRALKA